MDIDLLQITGGWFLDSNYNYLMEAAAARLQTFSFLFLGFLLILPLFARPLDLSKLSMASPSSAGRILSSVSPTTAMKLHPQQGKDAASPPPPPLRSSSSSSNGQFEAAAHEVPSGPNPESNR